MDPKEFVLLMLGAPVVKVELSSQQLEAIHDYVTMVVGKYEVPEAKKEVFIINGILAHSKYVLGRIRSKYQTVPGPNDTQVALDGQQLVYEGVSDITEWKVELDPTLRI